MNPSELGRIDDLSWRLLVWMMDKSESAARERRHIEALEKKEKEELEDSSANIKIMKKLGLSDVPPKHKGEGPEDGIPAPEGTRKMTAENDC